MQINIEKKHLGYFCLVLFLVGSLVVLATVPNPGHSISEIEDGNTICTTENGLCSGSGESYWNLHGDDIYYSSGNVEVRNGNGIELIGHSEHLELIFSDTYTDQGWKINQIPQSNALSFKYYEDSAWNTILTFVLYNRQVVFGSSANGVNMNVYGNMDMYGTFKPDVSVEFFEEEANPGSNCVVLGDGDWTHCSLSKMDFSEYGDHSRAGCRVELQEVDYPGSTSYHGSRGSWELCSSAETEVTCGATCMKFE